MMNKGLEVIEAFGDLDVSEALASAEALALWCRVR